MCKQNFFTFIRLWIYCRDVFEINVSDKLMLCYYYYLVNVCYNKRNKYVYFWYTLININFKNY